MKYIRREFICPVESEVDSIIRAEVMYDLKEDTSEYPSSVEADLKFTDCYKSITWDFSTWGYNNKDALMKDITEMRAKAQKVQEILGEFFTNLEEAYARLEAELEKKNV